MSRKLTLLAGIGLLTGPFTHCLAQPFIPKELPNESYSQAWTYLPNQGQVYDLAGNFRSDVLFHSVGTMPTVYLRRSTQTTVTFPDLHPEDSTLDRLIRMDIWLDNANGQPPILWDPVPMRYNFYERSTPGGITDVTGGKRVIYQNVYPNIDYHILSNESGPRFLIVARPGSDPNNIIFHFAGQDSLNVDINGFLKLHAADKEMVFPEGQVYQQQGETIIPISWTAYYYQQGPATVKLQLGAYNPALPLMISIQPLGGLGGSGGGQAIPPEWSTYMAGAGYDDAITDLTHDNAGNLYFTGYSRSTSGLPITTGLSQLVGGNDVILGRVDSHYEIQTPETWMTYYGGSGSDVGNAIAFDAANDRLAVCGNSGSPSTELVFPNGYTYTTNGSGLLALFGLDGHLQYSTRIEHGFGVAVSDLDVDQAGNTYVVGYGVIPNDEFDYVNPPGTADYSAQEGPQLPGWLGFDAFVMRFSPEMALTWSTAVGGPGDDEIKGCAVDNNTGLLYVVGITNTPNDLSVPDCPGGGYADFPLCNANGGYLQDKLNGNANDITLGEDGFISAFDLNTLHMDWSTYLGSPAGVEGATDVAVDHAGKAFVTGYTNMSSCSSDCVWIGAQNQFTGCDGGEYFVDESDGGYSTHHFLYRFNSQHDMTWGTFITGGHQEISARVTCDEGNNVYLFGSTNSGAFPGDDPVLPETTNPAYYNQGGDADAPVPDQDQMPYDTYLGGFDPHGHLFYSSYFGGLGNEYANAVAAFNGRVYICGSTAAASVPATLFPVHAPDLPGYQPYLNTLPSASTGDLDGFLAQVKYTFTLSVNQPDSPDAAGLHLYPNPATDLLTVESNWPRIHDVDVLNSLGQVVLRQAIRNGTATMDVSALPNAVYVIRAQGPEGSSYSRFIKQ